MQEEYITSEELFNSIKEDFYSFDNANLIDEGQFYRHVVYILGILGNAWYEEVDDIFSIEGYKLKLPSNFYMLDQVYRCFPQNSSGTQPDGIVLKARSFDKYPQDCEVPCNACPVPTNCILNTHEQLVVQRNNIIGNRTYSNFGLLSIGNKKTKGKCTGNCANLFSDNPDSITIEGNTLFTNFREGNIYIRYYAFPLDEKGLPMIPNDERIMKCIEYYIKSKIIENMWVNGDADVASKVSFYDAKYKEALSDAQYITKLSSFSTMLNQIKLVRKRLNVYQLNTTPRYNL